MSTCCSPSSPAADTTRALRSIALVGNPNCGKTTIFNALTGLRQRVANYPGVTVEKKSGRCKLADGTGIEVVDLPGTYSLISRSPDELVVMEVLRGLRPDTPAPDAVVVVVDASNLQRNLYLVSQLIELGRPMVVALNMMDVAERRGLHVDPGQLQQELGVPVIPVVGHKRQGIRELKQALAGTAVAPLPDWDLPQAMKEELMLVGGGLAILDGREGETQPQNETDRRRMDRYRAIAERLLVGDRAPDVAAFASREPVASLLESAGQRLATDGIEPMQADIEAHYRWVERVAGRTTATLDELAAMGSAGPGEGAAGYETVRRRHWTQRIDGIFVHKIWGLMVFALIMGGLFVSLFWLAKPLMEGIDAGVHALGAWTTARLPDGPLKALIADGLFAGVGAVVVFVPQIALLFLFLAVLEDSGYLARAAFLMDRLLSRVGLHGKSFIPLLSSFACAIPGIMATRTIENRKDRLATILVAPFMSCSARLPVYTLLIGILFAGRGPAVQAGVMLLLYALGIVMAAGVAWVFNRSMLKGARSAFILEMPSYKLPQASQVLRHVWTNTREFLSRAGTTILCFSVLLWALVYYPQAPHSPGMDEATHASQQIRQSYAGRLGRLMEPAIRPLGYDWKMGVGLIGAFAAREVFVSTMGVIYSAEEPGEQTAVLSQAMRDDIRPDGRPVWTAAVAASLLVWFVTAMQCMSTLAVVRRETGGWRWPMFMLLYMNALAYILSFGVYQVASRLMGS